MANALELLTDLLYPASGIKLIDAQEPKDQLQKRGRKSLFREEYILIAKAAARFGAIQDEIADELHINHATLDNWKKKYPEFLGALKAGKDAFDDRVERSLYQRAVLSLRSMAGPPKASVPLDLKDAARGAGVTNDCSDTSCQA